MPGVLPLYSNLGTAQLVLRLPVTASVITTVLSVRAAGACVVGIRKGRVPAAAVDEPAAPP